MAMRAPRLPASAFSSNNPLRALIMANSVMENKPFKMMSMTTIKISIPMSLPTDSISPYRFLSIKLYYMYLTNHLLTLNSYVF